MTAFSAAVELTRELLRCPSVTPEDAGALDVLQRALNAGGFACERKIFHEAGTPDVDNLFASIGEGGPRLVFAGHTDVVPPGDIGRWRFDPFSGEVAEGRLFGRGASDMKGAIAAFAAAALEYLRRHGVPKGAISFLITGDEEGPSINGTAKLLDWARERGERFDHCIVGEPTNVDALGDMMKIGRRGSLNGHEVALAAAGDTAVELQFLPCNARAFLTKPGPFTELVARAIRDVTGREPRLSTSGGTSDARFIIRDCSVVEFGLLNETIHAVDENAALADIDALTRVYFRILEDYFGGA